MRIKKHLDNTHNLHNTLYLSSLWSDMSCAAELVIAYSKLIWNLIIAPRNSARFNKITNYNDFWLALPLLTEDHDGDVGEHEGVDHEHDQDRTCHRGNRNSIFNILIITQEPDKLVHPPIEQTPPTEMSKCKLKSWCLLLYHPPLLFLAVYTRSLWSDMNIWRHF